MRKTTIWLMVFLLVLLGLAACSGPETLDPSESGGSEGYPVTGSPGGSQGSGYPDPDTPVESPVDGYPGPGIAPGEPHPSDMGPVIPGKLFVDGVSLVMMESFPLQMNATVQGSFSDGCTFFDTYVQEREGNTINIELFALRPAEMMCTEALVSFEQVIPVDINGLQAGTYEVVVNGTVKESFQLDVDNVLPQD